MRIERGENDCEEVLEGGDFGTGTECPHSMRQEELLVGVAEIGEVGQRRLAC